MQCSMDNEKLTTEFTDVIETIVKMLTPNFCMICNEQNYVICPNCEYEKLEEIFPTCYVCKARSDDFSTCRKCRRARARPICLWPITKFRGEAKRLVYKMKFDSKRDGARYIGSRLNEVVPWVDFNVVTYVPSSPKRVRERGYDHTRLIAKQFSSLRKLEYAKLLSRKNNSRQLGQSKTKRYLQAKESYEATPKARNYKKVLLIDDVVSTGATIEACTSLLKKAGVSEVYVACFAVN